MRYVLRRLAYLVAVLLAVTFLVSAMIDFLPGDPALVIVGENATPAQIAVVHKELHLDQPVARRYLSWLGHAVRGDLGRSVWPINSPGGLDELNRQLEAVDEAV